MRVFCCVLLLAGSAWAKPVSYANVDASTLRVFAVGTVDVATVSNGTFSVQVADPHAGHGTGFAVDSDLVITAEHVIDGARHVVIRLPGDGGFLPARVVWSDKAEDIAVLHVEAALVPLKLLSDDHALRVRQTIYAVGYPLDPARKEPQSAKGIISGQLDNAALQLDISLNPGNSGGPLVDESDTVVGMVVARGDVAKGVQGIGMAVPAAKLRAALAEARKQKFTPLTAHDKLSAEVVDELVRDGRLQPVREARDLEHTSVDQQIDQIATRIDDADLLVFVAGELWNASLAVRYAGVRTIGERTLTEPEAQKLATNLETASVRLAQRGREIDASVAARSKFVDVALGAHASFANVVVEAYVPPTSAKAGARVEWTLAGALLDRRNAAAGGGLGGELELASRIGDGVFFGWGFSIGAVTLDSAQTMALHHAFYAVEAGIGVRLGHLQLYGGIAPCYYSASATDLAGMDTTRSDFVFEHVRATASLDFARFRITSGVRVIGSTPWFEPIGLGLNF
jgi:hypothetical protein